MTLDYRTVFISDTHLGSRGARAEELSAFLKHVRCERLYLVGDAIDLWAMRSKVHWPAAHNHVVRRVLKLAKRGTHVVFIPGNHDDAVRQYAGLDFGGVRIALQAVHRTADGKSLLITHGDEYDLVVQNGRFISILGGWAYDRLVMLNRLVNLLRTSVGLRKWSFSHAIKKKVKGACSFMSNFEQALLAEARRRGMDGVVCGHIHQPALRDVDGVLYANCGDWIERCSALVEHADGKLELLDVEKLLIERGIEVVHAKGDDVPLELPQAALEVMA